MYQLEERILFDGAAAVDLAVAQQEQQAQDTQAQADAQAQAQADATATGDQTQIQNPHEVSPVIPADTASAVPTSDTASIDTTTAALSAPIDASNPSQTTADTHHVNVLVVSDSIENADELFKSANSETVVVRYSEKNTTGAELLQEITDALHGEKADSIGFVTDKAHDGALKIFSDSDTSTQSLSTETQQKFWNGVEGLLAEKGKVNIFASDLASTETGRHLVDSLSQITNHQVAASTDVTGDGDAGGDWELEYVAKGTGSVDLIEEYFNRDAIQSFDHRIEKPTEIAFVDSSVRDIDTILKGIGDQAEIVYLNKDHAFEQITSYLQGRTDVDAVHLVSDGTSGEFYLGNETVNSDFIASHQTELSAWGNAMSADGDIHIYGCDLAKDQVGQDLVNQISIITGTDVAASVDRTGVAGDWNLEFTTGEIQTAGFVIGEYIYNLKTFTVKRLDDVKIDNFVNINEADLTLRQAIFKSVDGDNIVFAGSADLYKPNGLTIVLADTLIIDKNITIDGTIAVPTSPVTYYSVTIDGGGLYRVLYINTQALVTETNIVIDPETGEKVSSTITLSGVTISNIIITNGLAPVSGTAPAASDGGGIYITGGTYVNSTDLQVINCYADRYGGGIYNAGTLNLTSDSKVKTFPYMNFDLDISSNIAGNSGGGIYNAGILTYEGNASLISGINNNTAVIGHGGGIYSSGSLSIDSGSSGPSFDLINNTAGSNGGGIYSNTGDVVLTGVYLGGNDAGVDGGAIHIIANYEQTSPVWLTDVVANYNTAGHDGGAIYFTNGNSASASVNVLNLEWCNFEGNHAGQNGGAVSLEDNSGTIFIKTVITPNSSVTVQSEFLSNSATLGGAIYIENCIGNLSIDFVNISKNSAVLDGGAVYIANSSGSITLSDIEMSGNRATRNGGGIFYSSDDSVTFKVVTSNISNNTAAGFGGGIYLAKGVLNIENCTLSYNGTDKDTVGGAIYMDYGTLNIKLSTMAYNMGIGAAIYIDGDNVNKSILYVNNTIIYNLDSEFTSGTKIQSQIYIPVLAERGTISFSNTNNIYSHYYKDVAYASDHTLNITLSTTAKIARLYGDTAIKSTAIQSNLWLDDTLRYHANYRTMALGILSQNSWAIGGGTGGIAYDQRGNTRGTTWTWDQTKQTWTKGSGYTIGAFEPLFHVIVNSKGDDSSLLLTGDLNAEYFSNAIGGSGLTLRESVYWIDTRAALDSNNPTYYTDPTTIPVNNFTVNDYNSRYIGFDSSLFSKTNARNLIQLVYNDIYVGGYWGYLIDSDTPAYRDIAIAYLVRNTDNSGNIVYHDDTLRAHDDPSRITVAAGTGNLFVIAAPSVAAINNLTLINGKSTLTNGTNRIGTSYNGGGIYNLGGTNLTRTTLNNVIVQDCTAIGSSSSNYSSFGGGIYNNGYMNIYDSGIVNNTVSGPYIAEGGGIYNDTSGTMNIDRTQVNGNVANNASARPTSDAGPIIVYGGGVYNSGNMLVERSEISGNKVRGANDTSHVTSMQGGGFYNSSANFRIANSTIAENTIDGNKGSGVWNNFGSAIYNDGTLYSYYNTIANNSITIPLAALNAASYSATLETLAGLYQANTDASTLFLSNCILVENYAKETGVSIRTEVWQRSDIYILAPASVDTTGTNAQYNVIGAYNAGGVQVFDYVQQQVTWTDSNTGITYYIYENNGGTHTKLNIFVPVLDPLRSTAGFEWDSSKGGPLNNIVGYRTYDPDPLKQSDPPPPYYIDVTVHQDTVTGLYGIYYFDNVSGNLYRYNGQTKVYLTLSGLITPTGNFTEFTGNQENTLRISLNDEYANNTPPPAPYTYSSIQPEDYQQRLSTPDTMESQYGLVYNMNLDFKSGLQYNGALTRTYRVLDHSVALDTGIVIANPGVFLNFGTDQRGVERGSVGNATNRGAFDYIDHLTVRSTFDSSTPRTGFDFVNYKPLWDSTTLTLREAVMLADDGTNIALKDGWRINGTIDASLPGGKVTNELDINGNLIFKLVSELDVTRSTAIDFFPIPSTHVVIDHEINGIYTWLDKNNTLHIGGISQLTAAANSRIFNVDSSVSNWLSTVAISNFTMSGGNIVGNGGGIFSAANLTLDNITIQSCKATASTMSTANPTSNRDGFGGAIYSGEGSLTLINSMIGSRTATLGNSALAGGGIYSASYNHSGTYALHMSNSSVLNNIAKNGTVKGDGGGIYLQAGDAFIEYSTIGNNKAIVDGGGIFVATSNNVLNMLNSTVSNNSSGRNGGGISFYSSSSLDLDFVTVANNQSGWTIAGAASANPYAYGGGIYMNSGIINISNSILAQNYRGSATVANPVHNDLYLKNIDPSSIDHSIYGTINGILKQNGTPDYILNITNSTQITDWAGFKGQIDTKLTDNGGRTLTVYVINSDNGTYNLKVADHSVGFDQTRLENFGTDRITAGAYENSVNKTLYYVSGNIGKGLDSGSVWVSANGVNLTEASGVLNATNAIFTFDDLKMTPSQAILASNWTLNSPDWVGKYYSWIEVVHNAYLTVAATATGATTPLALDGKIVVKDSGTLEVQTSNLTKIKLSVVHTPISDTTVIYSSTATQALLYVDADTLLPMNYDNLQLTGKTGTTASAKTSTGQFNVYGDLSVGNGTDNVSLSITGTTNNLYIYGANVHNFGKISAGDIVIDGTVAGTNPLGLTTVDGGGTITASRSLTMTSATVNGTAQKTITVGTTLSMTDVSILGMASSNMTDVKAATGNVNMDGIINLQNVTVTSGSGKVLTLGGTKENITNLTGSATIGASLSTVKLANAKIVASGADNNIISKGLDVSTAPAWADGKVIQVLDNAPSVGSSLSINIGAQTLSLTDGTTSSTATALTLGVGSVPGGDRLSVDTLSRLAFVTTGTVTSAVNVANPAANIDGTLSLSGKISLSNTFLTPVKSTATLELGGTITITKDDTGIDATISMANSLNIVGNVTINSNVTGNVSIASTEGSVVIGSDITAGSKFTGNARNLTVIAKLDASVGNIAMVKDLAVTATNGNIHLLNSITVTGNVTFTTDPGNGVLVHKAFATSATKLTGTAPAPIIVTAGLSGGINTVGMGYSSYLGDGSELQLSAGSTTVTSDLNTVNLNRSFTLLKGKYTSDGITLTGATANLIVKGTTLEMLGDISLAGGRLDNSVVLTSTGNILMNNGILNNLATGTLTLAGDLNLSGNASFVNAGIFNNAGSNIILEDGSLTNTKTLNALSIMFNGTGSLSNTSTVPMNIGDFITLSGGSLTNAGTLTAGGALTLTGPGALNNNTGSMTVATLTMGNGNFTNKAAFTTSIPDADMGVIFIGTGNINNSSTLNTNLITLAGGTLTNSGTITEKTTGALINISGMSSFTNSGKMLTVNNITFDGTGSLTNSGTLTVAGDITLAGGSLNNQGTGTLSAGNFITLTGNGALVNAGTMNNANTVISLQDSSSLTNTKVLTANSIIFYGSGSLNNNMGTLTADYIELATGNLANKAILNTNNVNFTDVGSLTNSGTIKGTGIASNITLLGGDLTNTGTGSLTIDNIYMVEDKLVLSGGKLIVNDTLMLNAVTIKISGTGIANVNSMSSVVRDTILDTGKLTVKDFYFGTSTDPFIGTQLTFQINTAATLEVNGAIFNPSAEHFFITQGTGKVWVKPTVGTSSVWITDSVINPVSQIDIAGLTTSKLVGLSTFKPLTVNGLWNGIPANPTTVSNSVNRVWTITRTTGDTTNLTMKLYWDALDQGANLDNTAKLYFSTGTTWGTGPIGTTDSGLNTFDINTTSIKSGSFGISINPIVAINDNSSFLGSQFDELKERFIDAIFGTREDIAERQLVAEAQERSAMENMFSQMANRGNLMERNKLFKTDIDLGLEELLAV